MPWTSALESIVAAFLANEKGDGGAAERHLRAAVDRASAADMALYAGSARRRLGELVGGEEGTALLRQADSALTDRGVRVPERFAAMLVPGRWVR
jgi:hypothetical protein